MSSMSSGNMESFSNETGNQKDNWTLEWFVQTCSVDEWFVSAEPGIVMKSIEIRLMIMSAVKFSIHGDKGSF